MTDFLVINSQELVHHWFVDWIRGLDLFIESVQKPDHSLRGCAHNQKCYDELMQVRDNVLEYLNTLRL